jgi:6-phosphogluconate dehydrogenase
MSENATIGLIGLGTMGANLALNIAEAGHRIAVFNRSPERTRSFHAGAGEPAHRIVPTGDARRRSSTRSRRRG